MTNKERLIQSLKEYKRRSDKDIFTFKSLKDVIEDANKYFTSEEFDSKSPLAINIYYNLEKIRGKWFEFIEEKMKIAKYLCNIYVGEENE